MRQILCEGRVKSVVLIVTIFFTFFEHISGGQNDLVGDTAYYLKVYNAINTFRSKHVSPSLKWNRMMNEVAETLAVQLAHNLSDHDADPSDMEGVNTYVTPGGKPSTTLVVSKWYNESSLYDYKHPGYNEKYLNFTQLVWKSSTTVGIGAATFNNVTVVLAKFFPRGNVDGMFRYNVIAPRVPVKLSLTLGSGS